MKTISHLWGCTEVLEYSLALFLMNTISLYKPCKERTVGYLPFTKPGSEKIIRNLQ